MYARTNATQGAELQRFWPEAPSIDNCAVFKASTVAYEAQSAGYFSRDCTSGRANGMEFFFTGGKKFAEQILVMQDRTELCLKK